jgi:hypothetical protein
MSFNPFQGVSRFETPRHPHRTLARDGFNPFQGVSRFETQASLKPVLTDNSDECP